MDARGHDPPKTTARLCLGNAHNDELILILDEMASCSPQSQARLTLVYGAKPQPLGHRMPAISEP